MAAAIDPNELLEEAAIIFHLFFIGPTKHLMVSPQFRKEFFIFYLLNLVVPGFERYQS
jgi:hypothetical protein